MSERKQCTRCLGPKENEEFYTLPSGTPDSWCKQCRIQYQKRYAADKRVYAQKYRANHPEKQRQWIEANREHLRQYGRDRYRKNKAKFCRQVKKRKLRLSFISGQHTEREWEDLLFAYNSKCFGCGRSDVEITRDHIVPISKGGTDNIENIAPLCRSCNSIKNNKGPEWYLQFWIKRKKSLMESAFTHDVQTTSQSV